MAEVQESGPIAGEEFTDKTWTSIFGDDMGVVSDPTGAAFGITLPTASDVAQIGSASVDSIAVVAGRELKIPAGTTQSVEIPPSDGGGSVGRTDRIVARYDPVAYDEDPGPVRLLRLPGTEGLSAAPDYDPATDLRLWRVRRVQGQGLNQATVVSEQHRIGRTILVESGASLPEGMTLGTRAVRAGSIYRRDLVSGVPDWVLESSPSQLLKGGTTATANGSDPNNGDTSPGWQRRPGTQMERDGKWRILHLESYKASGGTLTSTGSSGGNADQHLAGLHAQDRPPVVMAASARVNSIAGSTYYAGAHVTSGGGIYLNSWAPGITIGPAGPDPTAIIDLVYRVS